MTPGDARPTGLTEAEAARRLASGGPNEVPRAAPPSVVSRVVVQLRDPMILLLCGAFVVVLLIGDVSDGIIIAAVVCLNTVIGVVQEVRAERAVAALGRMAAPRAGVRRDGRLVELDARFLVPGDLVRLEAGDVVPADLELAEAVGLEVDEAAMTGESVPVPRVAAEDLLAGTVVTRGRGWGTVTRTGAQSGLGRIATLIAATGTRPTPLQRRLSRLSRELVAVTLALSALVWVMAVVRGGSVADSLILAVSLAVAAIPESLPAVVSVALALGAYRMARRSAIVRWLPAVETLGSVTVLASDKTGTLTEGRMTVQRLWSPDGECRVTGRDDGRHGEILEPGADGPATTRLLRDMVLCNDARIASRSDGTWRTIGDPMEVALLVAAAKRGVLGPELRPRWTRVDEAPFDSVQKVMRTVDRQQDGSTLEVVKGAPEVVLEGVETGAEAEDARVRAHRWATEGYRVLAVAESTGGPRRLAGLVGIADPPRDSAAEVVASCREAGIRLVMITGDHAATARAIAARVGILTRQGGQVADGAEVARGEHVHRVEKIDVYARTQPQQKVDIVEAWRGRGDVVAMTGDGVNDAPALRRADIGVAMGSRGTEVARQAADLVLADDDLRTVVTAVGEGRRIYANIRTFLRYALAGGLAEVMVILVAPFLGMPIPLVPAQILWINMLTHGVPGVAFGGEPLDPALMARPSPSPERSVLGGGLVRLIAVSGVLIAGVSLLAGVLATRAGADLRTWVFVTLGLAQLGLALALRAPREGLALHHRGLELSVLAAASLQLLAVSWSPLRGLLDTVPVSVGEVVLLAGLAAVPGAAVVAARVVTAHRPRRGSHRAGP